MIEINGGVRSLDEAAAQLERTDGVMIGRAVIDDPWLLADADARLHGDDAPPLQRDELLARVEAYVRRASEAPGFRPRWVHRHLSPLFAGVPGARVWRRTLSDHADDPAGVRIAADAVRAASP
jgi:tRNA-dihydrouridine synthase A